MRGLGNVCNEREGYTMSERRSCLPLPPPFSGLREHSEPTALHSTIAPQTQVPSDRPGPTPKLSHSPRGSGPHLGRAAPACQELNWEQDGQVIRIPARQSPRTMEGCHPDRDVIAFTTVFHGPCRFSTAFPVQYPDSSCTPPSHTLSHTHLHSHAHTTHTRSHVVTFTQEHTRADSAL